MSCVLLRCVKFTRAVRARRYDADGNGSVDMVEFIRGVRGAMPPRRRELVRQAFAKLDPEGKGAVDMDVVARLYNTKNHPDVRAGRRSEREVLEEFLDTFGVRDGTKRTISADDYEDYYEKISAACEDDNYFQLMMWNSWFDERGRQVCPQFCRPCNSTRITR